MANNRGLDLENVYEKDRKKIEEKEVPKFPFWDVKLYRSQEDFANPERAYRYFFRHGMIKISVAGKSFFYCEDLSDIQYPMTMEYSKYLLLEG